MSMLRLALLGLVVGTALAGDNRVDISGLLDLQLRQLNTLLSSQGAHQITLGNVSLGDFRATDVRLSDLATLVRRGSAYLWTEKDTIEATATVGLTNMTLTAQDIVDSGKSLGKSVVEIVGSGLSFEQRTQMTNNSCVQTYPKLVLTRVTRATITGQQGPKDITEMVNGALVGQLNDYLKSESVRRFVDFYLNQCRGMNNLKQLVAKGTGEHVPAGVFLGNSTGGAATASATAATAAVLLSALVYNSL